MDGAGFPGPLGDGDLGPLVHLLRPGWEATVDSPGTLGQASLR